MFILAILTAYNYGTNTILTRCDVATCRLSCCVKAITGDLNINILRNE
jgi:hypothetical protein